MPFIAGINKFTGKAFESTKCDSNEQEEFAKEAILKDAINSGIDAEIRTLTEDELKTVTAK